MAKATLPPVLVNKVLLEYNHTLHWLVSQYGSPNGDHLALYRKVYCPWCRGLKWDEMRG